MPEKTNNAYKVLAMNNQQSIEKEPVGGGFRNIIAPLRGFNMVISSEGKNPISAQRYNDLARYKEYLNDDYCLSCAYFKSTKGHFGVCKDLPQRKSYDGAKKGSACALWRQKTVFGRYGIKFELPEKPTYLVNMQLRRLHKTSFYTNDFPSCPHCQSAYFVSNGLYIGKSVVNRKFHCRVCDKYFSKCLTSDHLPKMKHPQKLVKKALDLRKRGCSLRVIAEKIESVSHKTIHDWLIKFGNHKTKKKSKQWASIDEKKLEQLWKQGKKDKEIALVLNRSKAAIKIKRIRLRLVRKTKKNELLQQIKANS